MSERTICCTPADRATASWSKVLVRLAGDRPIVVERGEHRADRLKHGVDPLDGQEGLQLARKRGVEQVLRCRDGARTARDTSSRRFTNPLERLAEFALEVFREPLLRDLLADLATDPARRWVSSVSRSRCWEEIITASPVTPMDRLKASAVVTNPSGTRKARTGCPPFRPSMCLPAGQIDVAQADVSEGPDIHVHCARLRFDAGRRLEGNGPWARWRHLARGRGR